MIGNCSGSGYGLFEFQSLGKDVVEKWKDNGASIDRYQGIRDYSEFRLADPHEILDGKKAKAEYYLLKILKKLNVTHSRF
jgi:hypothetical protein